MLTCTVKRFHCIVYAKYLCFCTCDCIGDCVSDCLGDFLGDCLCDCTRDNGFTTPADKHSGIFRTIVAPSLFIERCYYVPY